MTASTASHRGGTILTWGSPRQGHEFAAVASRYGLTCQHICEQDSTGDVRSVEDLVAEGAKAVANASSPILAFVSMGRATVLGGIPAIADAWQQLRQESSLTAATFIGPPPDAARILSDKWETHAFLLGCGLATPDARLVTVKDVSDLSYPQVLKARSLTGGAGIALVDTPAEARLYFDAIGDAGLREAVCSSFVPGIEVSVELLKLGEQWTCFPIGTKGFTSRGMRHADDKVKIFGHLDMTTPYLEIAIALGDELGIQGLLSVEGVHTTDGPPGWVILEAAPRVTGNLPMELAAAGGFSVNDAIVRHLLDLPAAAPEGPPRLAVEVPLYQHQGDQTVAELLALPRVGRAVLDDLTALPAASRTGSRIRVGFSAEDPTQLLETARAIERLCPSEAVVAAVAGAAAEVLQVFPSPVLCELQELVR